MKNVFKDKRSSIIVALIAMFLWGTAIPMIKITYKTLSIPSEDMGAKILVAGIRFFLAGLIVVVYKMIFEKKKFNVNKNNIKFFISIMMIQVVIQYIFYYIGLAHTTGVKSSIIQSLNFLIVIIFAHILMEDDKINLKKIIAVVIGIFAAILCNIHESGNLEFHFIGEGFIFISTTFNALGSVVVKKWGKNESAYDMSAVQFIFGGLILIIIGNLSTGFNIQFNLKGVLLILYGAFISSTAFVIWYNLLHYQKAGKVGIFKLFIPIFGSILSIIFLGDKFNTYLLIALGLTSFATIFLNSNIMEKGN